MESKVYNCDCLESLWVDFPQGKRKYKVNRKGQILSVRTGEILVPQLQKNGYYNIKIGCRTFNIHRIVAEAFIPNNEELPCINHKDGNKFNNNVDNLEWCTYRHNIIHAYSNGLRKNIKAVVCLLNGDIVKEYKSARDAEKDGFANQLIAKCCRGKRKTHKGYEWKYKTDLIGL